MPSKAVHYVPTIILFNASEQLGALARESVLDEPLIGVLVPRENN